MVRRLEQTELTGSDELLLKNHSMNALQTPSDRDYGSVRKWFVNERPLASEKEEMYIKQRDDIITLRQGRQWTHFHAFVERVISCLDSTITRVSPRIPHQTVICLHVHF
jgi:hypothetical protein